MEVFTEILLAIFTSEAFVNAVVAAIVAIIGVLAKYGVAFIEAQTEHMKTKTKNEELKNLLDQLDDRAAKVVLVLEETIVKELREKTADGKLTKEDVEEIQAKSKEMMIQTLNEESVVLLENAIGDLENYFTILLEAALANLKDDKKIVNKIQIEEDIKPIADYMDVQFDDARYEASLTE